MLHPIFRIFALCLTLILAACQSSLPPQPEGWINGRVLSTSGKPVRANIQIDRQIYTTDASGRFSFTPSAAPVYRLEVDAPGHYSMRHTFSHAELRDQATVDDIVLVERAPGRTLFVFGGDAMIGRRFYTPFEGEPVLIDSETVLQDSQALLAEMKPYLERADYAAINLETPIFNQPPGPAAPKSVTFYSAPETLEALEWAGVDYVALGNNHIYDFLEPGLDVTMRYLRESNLDYSGGGKDESEALKAHRQVRGSDNFDFLSFVGWPAGTPSQSADTDKGGAALGTDKNLAETTQASRASHGIPIVQFHGGLEYVEEPTLSVETKLKQAVDAGAAVVIGHHPHVVQGLELYRGKLMAWSLGNFLFDQYFYSAQSAALLYIWMDGDNFYHAEAVPLYIKGYHPTPAVGPMREAINRRLHDLSARRNTDLIRSGGHMILSTSKAIPGSNPEFDPKTDCEGDTSRTGHDLLARGDFDAYDLFGAPDRSWLDLDERIEIVAAEYSTANNLMRIKLGAGESIETGMRKFQRVFTPGNPMSIRADVLSTADVRVNAFIQIRATGQSLDEGLNSGRRISIGSVDLNANEASVLDIDFDTPRTRARSLRVLLTFEAAGSGSIIELDNLEFIEWRTPFTPTKVCENKEMPKFSFAATLKD